MKKAVSCLIFLFILTAAPVSAMEKEAEKEIKMKKAEVEQYRLPYLDEALIDQPKLDWLIERLEAELFVSPVDAELGKNGAIIPEEKGRALDREKFEIQFRSMFYGKEQKEITVPVKPVYPKVDTELLEQITSNRLGSYTTYYRTSNAERSSNVELAAEAINNTVVFPGESFSFNETVGERTVEKGYKRAPVIVRGEFSEDIGGGICQVSSTLFNAVDLKGIQIEERYEHSREVPYVPPGRDATVSWWGPDFSFKNMYNAPIFIRASAGKGSLTVSIYSSESAENFTGNN